MPKHIDRMGMNGAWLMQALDFELYNLPAQESLKKKLGQNLGSYRNIGPLVKKQGIKIYMMKR